MCVQTCAASPQYLSIGDSVLVYLELGRGLEALHHCETDFTRGSETHQGLT